LRSPGDILTGNQPIKRDRVETPGASVYFYELHEGDGDIFADLMLAHEEDMDAELFLETVKEIRERIIDTYHHDTLIEAIAEELERDHGFITISDDRLIASVNVSRDAAETFLSDLEPPSGDAEDNEDDEEGADYRAIVAEFQGSRPPRPH
jgi:hypothetical protein